jgi:hypothetical protein
MSSLKKILKAYKEAIPSRKEGIGFDVTDLVGPEVLDSNKGDVLNVGALLDASQEKIKPEAFISGQKDNINAFLSSSGKDDVSAGIGYLTKDKSTSFGLGATQSGKDKNVMFGVNSRFKKGGSVEVGKGKDYIKDLI